MEMVTGTFRTITTFGSVYYTEQKTIENQYAENFRKKIKIKKISDSLYFYEMVLDSATGNGLFFCSQIDTDILSIQCVEVKRRDFGVNRNAPNGGKCE
jgi:hypothetical protein